MSRNSSTSVSLLARGRRAIGRAAASAVLEELVGRNRHGHLARLGIDESGQRKSAGIDKAPQKPNHQQESEQARHFRTRGPPNRWRLPFQVTVYATVGFGYKYSMSDVVAHNGTTPQPQASLSAAL